MTHYKVKLIVPESGDMVEPRKLANSFRAFRNRMSGRIFEVALYNADQDTPNPES